MKHFIVWLAALLLISNLSPACAAEEKTITVTDYRAGDDSFLQICVGEEAIRFLSCDSYGLPYLDENSRIQIPVRRFAEATGGSVEYRHEDLSVTITCGDNTVVFVLGSNIMTHNGEAKEMDTTTQNIGGRTYIPLRAIAEALGYTVAYAREAAKSPECRIPREEWASMSYDDAAHGHAGTNIWYLTENDLDILAELYNQMCMSSLRYEIPPFEDTAMTYMGNASVGGQLSSGCRFGLTRRGREEIKIWDFDNTLGCNRPDSMGYFMLSRDLYDF